MSMQLLGFYHPYTKKIDEASRFDAAASSFIPRRKQTPGRPARCAASLPAVFDSRCDTTSSVSPFYLFSRFSFRISGMPALFPKRSSADESRRTGRRTPTLFDPLLDRFGPSPLSPGLTS